jgi:predicted permease
VGTADLAAYAHDEQPARLERGPLDISVAFVSSNFFQVLGAQPHAGYLLPHDGAVTEGEFSVVLGYEFWRRHFGGRSDVLGAALEINGHLFNVVGVTARHFRGVGDREPDIWLPLLAKRRLTSPGALIDSRDVGDLALVARLKEGASPVRALTVARTAATQLDAAHPLSYWTRGISLGTVHDLPTELANRKRSATATALLVVALTLVALVGLGMMTLLLVSGTARSGEIAIRIALGASTPRLIRLLAVEATVLALASSITGVLISALLLQWYRATRLHGPPVHVDGRFLIISAALAVAIGALGVGVPVFRLSRPSAGDALRKGRGTTDREHRIFDTAVVIGIAGSVVLLAGTGVFVKSLYRAGAIDLGFQPHRLMLASVNLATPTTEREVLESQRPYTFATEVTDRLRQVPGVSSVTISFGGPFQPSGMSQVSASERSSDVDHTILAISELVGPDYMRTLGLRLVRGRHFHAEEFADLPFTAIVSESLARALWPTEDPIGKCLRRVGVVGQGCSVVVGVVGDVRHLGIHQSAPPAYYLPLGPAGYPARLSFFIRFGTDPAGAERAVRDALLKIAPDLPALRTVWMQEDIAAQVRPLREGVVMFGFAGLATLLVAVANLYGVLSYRMARRTKEFGIRMALGARRRAIVALVVLQAGRLFAIGLAVGMPAMYLVGQRVTPLLYDVKPLDGSVFLTVLGAVAVAALMATGLPAWKVLQLSPADVLRDQ